MLEMQLRKLIGDAMYMCHGVGEAECRQLIKDKITDKVYDLMAEHTKVLQQTNDVLDMLGKLKEETIRRIKAYSAAGKGIHFE